MDDLIGHNSIKADQLRSLVERIESINAQKEELSEDAKQIFAEAKGAGYNSKTLRKIIQLRKMGEDERRQEAELLQLYAEALGLTDFFA